MHILVTGAGGQIGSALIGRLTAFAKVTGTNRDGLDLAQPGSIPAILDRLRPDMIVNAAGYTAVDKAESEPDLAHLINAVATGGIARWAAARNVPLVHFSTDYVFDGSGHLPKTEAETPNPLSAYGRTKLAGEAQIRDAAGPSLIVRTSWVYAAEGKNFLRTIARAAMTRTELRVVADQVGAPTSAALIADAVVSMLDGGLETFATRAGQADGLVHLTASGETSWHGFAEEIVAGLRTAGYAPAVERIEAIPTAEWPTPAARPLNSRLSLDRARSVFGIAPIDWRAALAPELDALARGGRDALLS